jgi:phage gp45-like
MIKVGTVTGREIRPNIDGSKDVLLLQVEITDPEDIQTVEVIGHAGEDSNPPDGSTVLIVKVGNAWKLAPAVNDGIEPDASLTPGEKKVYSSDGGTIKSFIKWLKNKLVLSGDVIEVNGSADFAVRLNALNTALQTMLTSLNADIVTAGGSGTTTLDISGAKVDTVKLP